MPIIRMAKMSTFLYGVAFWRYYLQSAGIMCTPPHPILPSLNVNGKHSLTIILYFTKEKIDMYINTRVVCECSHKVYY